MIDCTGKAQKREQALTSLFFCAGLLLALCGFVVNRTWQHIEWKVVVLFASIASASLVLAYLLGAALRCKLATSTALVWLAGLAYFWGFSALFSTCLILVSAVGLGSLFIPRESPLPTVLSALIGLALLCGIVGWLLPFPVHSRLIYLCCLLAIAALRWRAITDLLASTSKAWSEAVGGAPFAALIATTTVGLISIFAWLPTIGNDDLTYHVALPAQLQQFGYYHMDPASNVWALSAWAGDVLQGIGRVLAEADSRGAIDMLWLILTSALVWALTERLTRKVWLSWLATALYAGLATVASAVSGMQTEGPTAAVLAGLALTIQSTDSPTKRTVVGTAALLGLLVSLKISNILFAGPLGIWLLWKWRHHISWGASSMSVTMGLLIAASSYAYSYALTGNPFLPLFNGNFASPYFPAINFADTRWMTGFSWRILWDLVFHTSKFTESYDGTAGFFLIALAGSLAVALANPSSRPLTIVSIAALLLPLWQIQYLRYATPSFALLVPAMLSGTPWRSSKRWNVRFTAIGLIILLATDLLFASARDWQIKQGALQQLLTDGQSSIVNTYAPERLLADYTRYNYGESARILLVGESPCFGAPFAGTAFISCWYDPKMQAAVTQANQDPDGSSWSSIFRLTGVNLIILRRENMTAPLSIALQASHAKRVHTIGQAQLWELNPLTPGIATSAPPKAVAARFDTANAPEGPSFLHADVSLRCLPSDVPIVVAWVAKEKNGLESADYRWAFCTPQGVAKDSFHQHFEHKVISLTVQAQPGYGKDLSLHFGGANSHFRIDLMAERNLAKKIQKKALNVLRKIGFLSSSSAN